MKLPVSWLAEYIDISDLSINELADRITFAGIEIEGIEHIGPQFENIVVGEVRTTAEHPNADRLSIATVFDGEKDVQVVCGAPNCRAGLRTALAKVGAVLPGDFKIKKSKLRGVQSFGMLCSGRELGLSNEHEGILELNESHKPGTPLAELFGESETIFDVEITWNRADCMSIIGIAREFAAILNRPLKLPSIDFSVTKQKASELCSVTVHDQKRCPHYLARVLPHVERLPSPDWMRKRLELCGMRSIDIVVDVSNYVMLECGQPLHTFDYDCLNEHAIHVRTATSGEKIRTLDDTERLLDDTMLVIADTDTPLAIAGVMGGEGSEIHPKTAAVLLESANFNAPSIKETATTLGMHTESSHRFERGVDPFLTDWASRRACALLCQYANATVAEGFVDADARTQTPVHISLRFQRACDVIGMPISNERQIDILSSLNFTLVKQDAASATFNAPSYRIDVNCEADLIEEIARINGLEALPDALPATTIAPDADDASIRATSRCRKTLIALGFTEIMNYSFTSPATLKLFAGAGSENRVVLPNPVSADISVMRDSLIPQMIETMGYNHSHGTQTATLFEMGRVFFKNKKGKATEEDRVCIGLMGFAGRSGTDSVRPVENDEAVRWLKGALESLGAKLHTPPLRAEPEDTDGFEPGWAAALFIAGKRVGTIGLVTRESRQKWRIASPLVVAEIFRNALIGNVFKTITAKDVPAFPATTRDIALMAPPDITHEQIVTVIQKNAPPELRDIRLFDIFKNKKQTGGKTSLAYSLEYRAADRTLTDEEANTFHEKIKTALKTTLNVEIREG